MIGFLLYSDPRGMYVEWVPAERRYMLLASNMEHATVFSVDDANAVAAELHSAYGWLDLVEDARRRPPLPRPDYACPDCGASADEPCDTTCGCVQCRRRAEVLAGGDEPPKEAA